MNIAVFFIANAALFLIAAIAFSKSGLLNITVKFLLFAFTVINALFAMNALGYLVKVGG